MCGCQCVGVGVSVGGWWCVPVCVGGGVSGRLGVSVDYVIYVYVRMYICTYVHTRVHTNRACSHFWFVCLQREGPGCYRRE